MASAEILLKQAEAAWRRERGGKAAPDPRALRPQQLVAAINATSLGPVLLPRQLRRHRDDAGHAIGDVKRIDLFRYAGWLFDRRHAKVPSAAGYEAHRDRMGQAQRDKAKSVRDIGQIPACRLPRFKERCRFDLALFLKGFFPDAFPLPFSTDQLRAIRIMQDSILHGGLFAVGMPRGSGKTTISEYAALWALFYGHRNFVSIIGPDEDHAQERLRDIKTQIEFNERLLRAFPEVCYPIRRLEGIPQRRLLFGGDRVLLRWEGDVLLLPNIPGSAASGGMVGTCSITGQIRGQKLDVAVTDLAGKTRVLTRRPDFAIVDDPQTRESAKNPQTSRERAKLIQGDVLGLCGPGKKMAAVMPCTVIYPGDLSDIYLDRTKKPEWQGIRTKMLNAFPGDMKLWKEYAEIRAEGMKAEDRGAAGDAFLREHWDEMHAGAEAAWEARLEGCLSAVQNAMNHFFDDPESFWAEYQNQPRIEQGEQRQLETAQIIERINGFERGACPNACQFVTAFIDLQIDAFYWIVCGWDQRFTGWVLDYGTFPDQERINFFYGDLPRPLREEPGFKELGFEDMLFLALQRLTSDLMLREWTREDGAPIDMGKCLIDANWGDSRDVVYRFIGQSAYRALLTPSHGMYIGAKSSPFNARGKKDRDLIGENWRMPAVERRGEVRHCVFDTNYWKSKTLSRLLTPPGSSGSLTLWGDSPQRHDTLALHWTSEKFKDESYAGRVVREWSKPKPTQPDNHWWDGIVGCGVGASICGASVIPAAPRRPADSRAPQVNLAPPPGHGSFFVTDR